MNDALILAKDVRQKTDVINEYWPESAFIPISVLENSSKFPSVIKDQTDVKMVLFSRDNIEEYITDARKEGLTHIITDNEKSTNYRMPFLLDIYKNEQNYPFLEKIFDSGNVTSGYKIKIFKINYDRFEKEMLSQ